MPERPPADRNVDTPEEANRSDRHRALAPAAERALAEAAARRARQNAPDRPEETGGPKGPEPTRFGDWERKGIASDF